MSQGCSTWKGKSWISGKGGNLMSSDWRSKVWVLKEWNTAIGVGIPLWPPGYCVCYIAAEESTSPYFQVCISFPCWSVFFRPFKGKCTSLNLLLQTEIFQLTPWFPPPPQHSISNDSTQLTNLWPVKWASFAWENRGFTDAPGLQAGLPMAGRLRHPKLKRGVLFFGA